MNHGDQMDTTDAHEKRKSYCVREEGRDESDALCRGKEERDGKNGNAGTSCVDSA